MNTTLDNTDVQRDLPAIWEVLRAASGLVAVLVLAGVLAATVLIGDTGTSTSSTAVAATASQEPAGPRIVVPPAHPWRRVLTFYLVSTPDQAQIADWDEQAGSMQAFGLGNVTPDRDYKILYAGDEEQQRLAAQAILDAMLALKDVALVDVIDLRSLAHGDR